MWKFLGGIALSGALPMALVAPVSHPPPALEMLPHPTAYRMANVARAIVEGKPNADGTVTVAKRHYVQPGDRVADTIRVSGLSKMSLTVPVWARAGKKAQPIAPHAVLLFLRDNPEGDEWTPLHHIGRAARGVLWFDGEGVWGYAQVMNPGDYGLSRWRIRDGDELVMADSGDVRELVTKGLAARARWEETLRIGDRAERARAVARWFSPSTSPDGERWDQRVWPDVMQACDELGELMSKPLARIVRVDAAAEAVAAAASALGRLGPRARSATPSLIARLRDLRGVQPIFLVRALHRLADPRAVDVLRDYVAHEDLFVVAEAAAGLQASGGQGVAELLAARMPESIGNRDELGAVATLLEVLHSIDPARAEGLVKERFLEYDQLMMQRPWLRRLRHRR